MSIHGFAPTFVCPTRVQLHDIKAEPAAAPLPGFSYHVLVCVGICRVVQLPDRGAP